MGMCHRRCLEAWLTRANRDKCEICKFQFVVERRPKPLCDFFWNPPGNQTIHTNMLRDALWLFIMLAVLWASYWFSVAWRMAVPESDNDEITAPGLISWALFLLITYIVSFLISLQYHFQVWREWQRKNQQVYLVVAGDKTPTLTVRDPNNNASPGDHMQPLGIIPNRGAIRPGRH